MLSGEAISLDHDGRAVRLFLRWDFFGSAAGLVIAAVANLILGRTQLWFVALVLVLLCVGLKIADRLAIDGHRIGPLILIALGNWITALVVALVLPFLWPVMAITVLMPLVLATPYLSRTRLVFAIATTVLAAGLVSAFGLLNDDGGALPDIDDGLELVVVIGALMAQIAPIGLIVWQNNRLQRENLNRASALNDELHASQGRLAESRRRVVEAADTERRRIERDLHDGAQQRLVALGVRLRLLEAVSAGEGPVAEHLPTLLVELDEAVKDVRELAQGIYPPLLQSRGLVDALTAVARRSPLQITSELDDVGRLPQSIETAIYFTALEALTNAAKHAPDSNVHLSLNAGNQRVRLEVRDDGPGFDTSAVGGTQGTINMDDRVAANGGELALTSVPGRGTTVIATIPLDPSTN